MQRKKDTGGVGCCINLDYIRTCVRDIETKSQIYDPEHTQMTTRIKQNVKIYSDS